MAHTVSVGGRHQAMARAVMVALAVVAFVGTAGCATRTHDASVTTGSAAGTSSAAASVPQVPSGSVGDESSGAHAPSRSVTTTGITTEITTAPTASATRSVRPAVTPPKSLARATAALGAGGVSVSAVDLHTGRTLDYGATGGMLSGSIAKLPILETLLLQRQAAGRWLTEDEQELAARMIEHSDNEAANDLDEIVGAGPGLRRAAHTLGVRHTSYGPSLYWGFDRTSATDNIALLRNLVGGPALTPRAREYVLGLMAGVEADQRWGVSAAADPDTTTHLKNGWLDADPDGGRWLVNSVGIITAEGHEVLVAVLTQHGRDFDSGVDLVERLAKITLDALEDA